MSKTLATIVAISYFALTALVATTRAATTGTLHKREHRQIATLARDRGTVRFFRRHLRLAHTPIGRRALRFAKAEIRWTLAELRETRKTLHVRALPQDVSGVITYVFGPHAAEAKTVALCESGFSTSATNGQYFGVFQMGSHERARYGGSSLNVWDQVRAAYRYYRAAGWRPWECRP
jgi:hypothetical protein